MSAPAKPTTTGVVMCPFFKDDTRKTRYTEIHCEGLTDTSNIVQRFNTAENQKRHKRQFCMDAYKRCAICRMIMLEKYSEEVKA